MMRCIIILTVICLPLFPDIARAQTCPPNIGFENGTFDNWQCYAGNIDQSGTIKVSLTSPVFQRHVMLKNTYPQETDPYGGFPIYAPNGSNYSIRLGNDETGAEAERVSYSFTIPAGQDFYSIIYDYAVVLQNPNHQEFQQPKFTANVFDVTDNHYIDCGSFSFIASATLPGFQLSKVSQDVYYKTWSPVTIKLVGYAGKTIRLEFTTNDCTQGGHFGYAYMDVIENCTSPITGNTYCDGAATMVLTAPFGFEGYRWFPADFSKVLGTENVLRLSPPPALNTVFALEVSPYPGLGCLDTLYTTIKDAPDPFDFVIKNQLHACGSGDGIDLTADSVTAGSTPGLKYSYFQDSGQLNYVPAPAFVKKSGTYYIKGENGAGCNDIKPVVVSITDPPALHITNPPLTCPPAKADITVASITAGSRPANLLLSYWNDVATQYPLPNPAALDETGSYYIKAIDSLGCYAVQPVDVVVGEPVGFTVTDQTACGILNLTAPGIAVSPQALQYTYWQDAGATAVLSGANRIKTSNTYYIKGTTQQGCSLVQPVHVIVNPLPVFTVTTPAPVIFPATIDLTALVSPAPGVNYSYWTDSAMTLPAATPTAINNSGTYYIKATDQNGCETENSVVVLVGSRMAMPSAFSPNGDGKNDVLRFIARGGLRELQYFKIFDRWGHLVYSTHTYGDGWDGTVGGNPADAGVYVWMVRAVDFLGNVFEQKGTVLLVR